jgi:hypothetical protein
MARQASKAVPLRLCIDRVLPDDMKAEAAKRSISINPANDPLPMLRGALRRGGMAGVSIRTQKLAIITGKKWLPKGQVLGVRFLDGSKTQRAKVQQHAEEWMAYASVRFDWSAGASAQVRISFQADPGSWSAIGTDCLHTDYFKKSEPTMNFGWLRDDTDDVEYRRVVVHEFGHALGAIHEHQNPKGGIVWNEQAVYAAFSGPPNNWSRDEIRSNILDKYSYDQLNGTKFDPKSIMLYPFPKELIKGPPALARTGTATNTDLSAQDKRFIGTIYPKA